MADHVTATTDASALIDGLGHLGDRVLAYTKAAAQETAGRIEREMRARVAIRTGHTRAQIRVEDDRERVGYVVLANDPRSRKHVDFWLEYGTRAMRSHPFFYHAAQLETGPHDRRMREAIQAAIDGIGLGD